MSRASAMRVAPFLSPILILYAILLIAPYLLLFRMSLNQYSSTRLYIEDFSLDNYLSVLTDGVYLVLP